MDSSKGWQIVVQASTLVEVGESQYMPLFGPKSIPATSYGYQPPLGATTVGWTCLTQDCRVSEYEAVKRCPKACPKCGSTTEPLFNLPWEHDAWGVELQYKIRNNAEGLGFYEDLWEVRPFEDAVLSGHRESMARVRASVRAYAQKKLSTESWWFPGNIFFHFTWTDIKTPDLDGGAEDLIYWINVSSVEDVENDNSNRTNSHQVIDQADEFLQAGGSNNPKAAGIKQGALRIAKAARTILNNPQQDAVKRMQRS
jgi:hypothetical protein